MSYGLYDGDLKLYPRVPFFNLELMKLSTYYRNQRELVTLSLNFKPQMYSHFIVRQDYPAHRRYSATYTNVEYGGRAFNSKYVPLPDDIEFIRPNIDLYAKIESKISNNQVDKTQFSVLRRAEHIRLSVDGKTISPYWYKQLRNAPDVHGLIFHDYDLGAVDGSFNFIQTNLNKIISSTKGRRVGMKFPTQLSTEEELLNWLTLPCAGELFSLQYNGILTDKYIKEFKELRPNSTAIPQTSINVTANQTYEEFTTTGIIQAFKSILDLRRARLYFPLIYGKDFFIDKRWEEIVKLISFFNDRSGHELIRGDYFERVVPYETFFSFIRKITKQRFYFGSIYPVDKARELFQFVREQNYELFCLFYEYTGELK